MTGSRAGARLGVAGPRAPKTANAEELLRWRARHGLTQVQAGEELGISADHVQAIEAGRFNLSTTVRKLMEALDLLSRYS